MTLTACGNSSDTTEKSVRVSTQPIDEAILGTWLDEFGDGYRFTDDRFVSLIMDKSYAAHFQENGDFAINEQVIPRDTIEFDGKDVRIFYTYDNVELGREEDMDILLMTRDGKSDDATFDGTYTVTGGVYAESILDTFGLSVDKADLHATVLNDTLSFTVENYCYFETINGYVDMFSENMVYVDENADCVRYTYKVDGDTINFNYVSHTQGVSTKTEVYKKVK